MRITIPSTQSPTTGRDVRTGPADAVVTGSRAGRTTPRTPAGTSLRSTPTTTDDVDRRL